MPAISQAFEFYNPWSTRNSHTSQCSITMPQMVNGQRPPTTLTLFSAPIRSTGYFRLGSRLHNVAYTVEGSFKGSCMIQVTTTPNPGENDWSDLTATRAIYTGLETTGSAGVSGGFSGAVSRPTYTTAVTFTGDYAWCRIRLDIRQGTLQSARLNY